MDPLVLLRNCTKAKKKVRLADDEFLEFEDRQVHMSAKCGFKLSPTDSCIDIGSVWFMFKEISGDRPYTQDVAKKRGFKYISVAQRGDLCDWLAGHVATCRGLIVDVVEGRKRPAEDPLVDTRTRRRLSAGRPAPARPAGTEAAAGAGQQDASGGKLARREQGSGPGSAVANFNPSDITWADTAARVRPVKDLDVLVRCPGRMVPNADLILKIAQDEVNNWHVRRRLDDPADAASSGKVPLLRELEIMVNNDKTQKPIILVPCNKNSPINILNAVRFLQDGGYDKTDLEHQRFFESTRCEYVDVVRNVGGKMWTFEVRDTAKNFTKAHWLRVVAVIADGSAWQFTGWPFETIVDLFTTIKGVFFREVGMLTPLHVREWQVSILQMHPVQFQHRFGEVRDAFWVEVEKFMSSYRDKKYVNHTSLEPVKLSGEKPKPVL